MTYSSSDGVWEIVPKNAVAEIILGLLTVYLLFRALCWMAVLIDVYSKVPTRQIWRIARPDPSTVYYRLYSPIKHVFFAAGLLGYYLLLAGHFGWINFVSLE